MKTVWARQVRMGRVVNKGDRGAAREDGRKSREYSASEARGGMCR